MSTQKGVVHIALPFVLIIVAILIGGFVALKTGTLPQKLTSLVPGTVPLATPSVVLQSQYTNPFDSKAQYVNPFSDYKNPFNNIQ